MYNWLQQQQGSGWSRLYNWSQPPPRPLAAAAAACITKKFFKKFFKKFYKDLEVEHSAKTFCKEVEHSAKTNVHGHVHYTVPLHVASFEAADVAPMCSDRMQALEVHKQVLRDHILKEQAKTADRVELCSQQDYKECLDIFVRSFAADPPNPSFLWTVKDDKISSREQMRRLQKQIRYMLRYKNHILARKGILLGVRGDNGELVAAASLMAPGVDLNASSAREMSKLGIPPAFLRAPKWGLLPAKKMLAFSALDASMAKREKQFGLSWNVHCIGVLPRVQGTGMAAALMRTVCALADYQRLPATLECETEWHERLYARYGFETIDTVVLSVKGHPVDTQKYFVMIRKAADAAAVK